MFCIISNNTDPYFNLAAEEYFFKEFNEDIFMLWRSEPAVIVGKHQNALAEINYNYVKNNDIKIARRLSGGGTVYHDLGNINFTFIVNGKEDQLVNFKRFIKPVLQVLHDLSVNAELKGRNNIMINNRKISGNAEHIFRERVLHHGTLLFNTRLDILNESIRVIPGRYRDKAVKSIREMVTNIEEYLHPGINILDFRDLLLKHVVTNYHNPIIYKLNNKDIEKISKLIEVKYSTWEWIYGYSPKYSLDCIYKTDIQDVLFRIFVENGIIKDLEVKGIYDNEKILLELPGLIKGVPHRESDLKQKADKISEMLSISKAEAYKLIDSMF
jgi:lipoate-protein ligase A